MIERVLTIPNPLGLHARAAAKLVHTASRFKAKLLIEKDHQTVNGKSIMGILLLAAGQGTTLRFILDGPDEAEASAVVFALVDQGFGELPPPESGS